MLGLHLSQLKNDLFVRITLVNLHLFEGALSMVTLYGVWGVLSPEIPLSVTIPF